MRRARLIPLLFFLAEPAALRAQARVSAEVGRSVIEQPELPTSGATTAAASLEVAHEHSLIQSTLFGTQTSDGRQTAQWLTLASLLSPSWKRWALQGTGAFSAFGQTSLAATTSRDLLLQARTGSLASGVAIGGGLGTTIHNATAIPSRRATGSGWYSLGAERLRLDLSLTRTRSVFGGSSILVDISRRNANYADLGAGWMHDGAAWSASLGGGIRGRNGTFDSDDNWQAANLTAWVASHVALTVDVGRSLEDLVRGVPRTKYVSVGLRAASLAHRSLFARARLPAGPRVIVSRGDGDLRRVQIVNATAKRVELMADFTDWNPVDLQADGAAWRLERAITAGLHRIVIRIDGGEWIVPRNLPHTDDELGGTVGLLTVP